MNQKVKIFRNFIINHILLIAGIIVIYSGLTLQLGFHAGGPHHQARNRNHIQDNSASYEKIREINTQKVVNKLTYHDWSVIHKYAIVVFSMIMIYHFYLHLKWYKNVLSKRLIGKNFQVITLTFLFLIVAITGLIPWIVDLSNGPAITRMIFIEIHDKITLIFMIYIILHVINRISWFNKSYVKIKEVIGT